PREARQGLQGRAERARDLPPRARGRRRLAGPGDSGRQGRPQGAPSPGLRRRSHPSSDSGGCAAMSTAESAPLRPLDLSDAGDADAPRAAIEALPGITPPRKRGGAARFISDVVVELGFVPNERVDAAV